MPRKNKNLQSAKELMNKGDIEVNQNNDKKAKEFYLKAVEKLSNPDVESLSCDYWATLANCQYKAAILAEHEESDWLEVIASLTNIPKDLFSINDWRILAHSQALIANDPNSQETRSWLNESENSLKNSTNYIDDDWRILSLQQSVHGKLEPSHQKAFDWHKKSILSLQNVKTFLRFDWCDLAVSQFNAARRLNLLNEWKEAQHYLYLSLDSLVKLSLTGVVDFTDVLDNYEEFELYTLGHTSSRKFFSFAIDVFDDVLKSDRFDTKLKKFYLEIVESQQSTHLRRAFLQFMHLLKGTVKNKNFPNQEIKTWLEANQNLFEKMLKNAEAAYQPARLLDAMDQTPNLSVAIVNKLQELEKALTLSRKKIEKIEKENKKLKSIYQTKLTTFKPGTNKRKAVESTNNDNVIDSRKKARKH